MIAKAKIIAGLAVLGLAVLVGWQIASCELASLELQSDLRFLSAQIGTRIGLDAPSADEELRATVIRKAQQHDIQLEPQQVTVEHSDTGLYLAVDYKARVNLLGYSFTLHCTPSSTKRGPF